MRNCMLAAVISIVISQMCLMILPFYTPSKIFRNSKKDIRYKWSYINPLTHNDHYNGRTAPLTSNRYILYINSTNTGTEYFKYIIYSSFFFSSKCSLFHNSNVFGSCFVHILYIVCATIKKIILAPKVLKSFYSNYVFLLCRRMEDHKIFRSLNEYSKKWWGNRRLM